mmetsp:Transcript_98110/g.263697  ORF Transcript_98110/g.263697 Transcript_98110/m.263697 type:complete len:294 (-) Transcript_98110:100-981(-)
MQLSASYTAPAAAAAAAAAADAAAGWKLSTRRHSALVAGCGSEAMNLQILAHLAKDLDEEDSIASSSLHLHGKAAGRDLINPQLHHTGNEAGCHLSLDGKLLPAHLHGNDFADLKQEVLQSVAQAGGLERLQLYSGGLQLTERLVSQPRCPSAKHEGCSGRCRHFGYGGGCAVHSEVVEGRARAVLDVGKVEVDRDACQITTKVFLGEAKLVVLVIVQAEGLANKSATQKGVVARIPGQANATGHGSFTTVEVAEEKLRLVTGPIRRWDGCAVASHIHLALGVAGKHSVHDGF